MANQAVNEARYLCNPDVVLREEDEDGGLLYNPDNNAVKVVNATGLFIWKQFLSANQIGEVAKALQANFEDVPADQVEGDVKEFLDGMLENGFIGMID